MKQNTKLDSMHFGAEAFSFKMADELRIRMIQALSNRFHKNINIIEILFKQKK